MLKSLPVAVVSALVLCLLFSETAKAQDSLIYATVDYDSETNTVYGYAYTEPDYAASIYYQSSWVGAILKDADNNQVGSSANSQTWGRAEVSLEASGNGNPPYKIESSHYVIMNYSVYSYWDPYSSQYENGYLDYYYYTYYAEGGGGLPWHWPIFFSFTGRSPETVTPSMNCNLGTLLSEVIEALENRVSFKTARVGLNTVDFDQFNNAEMSLNQAQCSGGHSNSFTLTLAFWLPPATSGVFQPPRSFMHKNDVQDQYQQNGSLSIHDVNLSGDPKSGRASVSIVRKQPSTDFPNNKVRITIAGTLGGGGAFSNAGAVKFICP